MMPEAKKGFALLGGAAVLALAVTCLGGAAGWATGTAPTPMATGPAAPPSTTSAPPAPVTEPEEPREPWQEGHDLGGGAGGGMG